MSLYVRLESCPCGTCGTSWSRGQCAWKTAGQIRVHVKPENRPANFDELEAIGALWDHRAADPDGYSREDEIEWYRHFLKREATEEDLAKWGRSPIDWAQVSTEAMVDNVRNNIARTDACSVRTARLSGEAYTERTGIDWRTLTAAEVAA